MGRVAQLGWHDQGGIFEFDRLRVRVMSLGRIGGDGEGLIIHGWVLVVILLRVEGQLVVSDIGEGGATVDRMVGGRRTRVQQLQLLPLVVVGVVVDVVGLVVVCAGIVVIQLLEKRAAPGIDGVLVVDGLVLDHHLGVSAEVGVWRCVVEEDGKRFDRMLEVDGREEVGRAGRRRPRGGGRVGIRW